MCEEKNGSQNNGSGNERGDAERASAATEDCRPCGCCGSMIDEFERTVGRREPDTGKDSPGGGGPRGTSSSCAAVMRRMMALCGSRT